jgi:hypothetical protein
MGLRLKKIAVVGLALCAGGVGMCTPTAAAATSPIGAHSMLQLGDPPSFMAAMFREAAAMHASTLRMDVAPSIVFGDSSGPPDFSGLDEVMALAQQYHLRVIGDLFTVPASIASCSTPTPPDQAVRCGTDDLPDYGSMISKIVSHADPVIRDWEIWNEPDSGSFFTGTPQQYAWMLKTAHDSIKQVDPQANVLLGGLSGTSAMNWLAQVFAVSGADAAHDFDTTNIHERSPLAFLAGDLRAWRRFLAVYGVFRPLWVTEHGYPSDPAYQYDPAFAGGAASQAAYLTASVPTLIDAGASQVFVTERDNLSGQWASEGVLGGNVFDPPVSDPQVVEKPSYAALSALAACYEASGHDCPGPGPAAAPSSVAMPPTTVGSSVISVLTVSNPGAEPLPIGSLTLVPGSGEGIALRSDGCSDQIIEPGQTCRVVLGFAPTLGGSATAALRVPSDQGTLTVPVSAVAPSVSSLTATQPAGTSFRPISADGVGYLQRMVLTLANPLSVPVHVTAQSLSGTDPGQFLTRLDLCASATLAPGATCSITVMFAPTRAGRASAGLTLSGDGTPLQVALSATAFPRPRVSWTDLPAANRCLAGGPRRRVRVLVSQPGVVRWRIESAARGPRCGASSGRGAGARSSAHGHAVTGQRLRDLRGHRGYLATVMLPSTLGRQGLRAGGYRLTLTATNRHGTGDAAVVPLAVVG